MCYFHSFGSYIELIWNLRCRYRAKNRKNIIRNKEHRNENHSPNDKTFVVPQEDYYPITNTEPNPVSVPNLVPIPRMPYDVPINVSGIPYSPAQPLYPPTPANFSQDLFNPNHQGVILSNGGPYFPHQPEFITAVPPNTSVDISNTRQKWGQAVSSFEFSNFINKILNV